MDIQDRRKLLKTERNPDPKLDYVISISGEISAHGSGAVSSVHLRYVPDKVILETAAFGKYLNALSRLPWATLEEAAAAVLNDVNNELIARWVQVAITAPPLLDIGIDRHEVLLEDRQPKWDNAGLLSRLRRH